MYNEITPEVQRRIDTLVSDYSQAAIATIGERFPLITKAAPIISDGEIYLLLSDLSEHTKNITESKRIAIYFAQVENHRSRLNNPRYTVMGKVYKIDANKLDEHYQHLLDLFDKKDAGAKMYGMFGDFNIYRFEQYEHLYNEGYGKAYK
jgi:putative heme iron utilization protein